MSTVESTAPILPPELEHDIFELAGWNDLDTSLVLLLVARRVYVWIEPLLYRVLLVSTENDLPRLEALIDPNADSARADRLRIAVRHLALSTRMERATLTLTLRRLSSITDLALWTGDTYPELLADMQSLTQLTRLSVNLFALLGGAKGFTLPTAEQFSPLGRITHLDVFGSTPNELIPVFGMFPALTHLALTDNYLPELIESVLALCSETSTLRLVVVVWTHGAHPDDFVPAGIRRIRHPRFCTFSCSHFEEDWKDGAWGGMDFWRQAEKRLDVQAKEEQQSTE
ncbi:hypothetical protein C8F01DRAFT_1370315 [Mycena amicta]|nr:hypothetical protein C8F01DRAFT_1370315 [Mycena amicta]